VNIGIYNIASETIWAVPALIGHDN